jgi:iron(III) transport system substrate-binding protein
LEKMEVDMWHMRWWAVVAILQLMVSPASADNLVNIYSAREEALIKPLLDKFTERTGIKANLVTGKPEDMMQRLLKEGADSPADVLLTTDADYLNRAQKMGFFQPVRSDILGQAIPASYRDPEGNWFGLSLRARVIMYATDRVNPANLSTYDDLAASRWKNKVCVRSSKSVYNVSLVSAMIARQGSGATEAWASGLVTNFARPPEGGDRDQIKAVASGLCDVALVNSYYLGGMLNSSKAEEREAAARVGVVWPNQKKNGVHVNISGAGVIKNARNRDNAIRLLEFLASEEAQRWYAEANYEYPVRPGTPISSTLASFGKFKADDLKLVELGDHMPAATRLMYRVGWQ